MTATTDDRLAIGTEAIIRDTEQNGAAPTEFTALDTDVNVWLVASGTKVRVVSDDDTSEPESTREFRPVKVRILEGEHAERIVRLHRIDLVPIAR